MGHDLNHNHSHTGTDSRRALAWAFGINAAFLVIEAIAGWISGSLALLADAGHMLSDVVALGVALWVAHLVVRKATPNHSYGFGRVEVLSGLLNGLALWIIAGGIAVEAFRRFQEPSHVDASIMLPVAVAGLIANFVSAWILWKHREENLNLSAAFLHLAADAAGSIGAIFAALAIIFYGWNWVDPVASIVISALIVISSWSLVRRSIHILLEGAPSSVNPDEVHDVLEAIPGVKDCHDLHIWNVGSAEPMLTAHLTIKPDVSRREVLRSAAGIIRERFAIRHTTLQVEDEPCPDLHS